MQISEVIGSAGQSLTGNKLRTGLTMLGIIIGISSVIMITSIGQGAIAFVTDQLNILGASYFRIAPGQNSFSQVASSANPLTTKDAQALRNSDITNLNQIAPLALATATVTTVDEQTRTTIRGVPPELLQILNPKIVYGNFISEIDNETKDKVAVIGVELAEELFGENTNPVGESIRIDNTRYQIIGVSEATNALTSNIFNNDVLIPINSLITYITGVDKLFQITVSVDNQDRLQQTIQDVEVFLRDYRDIDPDEEADFFIQSFEETLDTIQTVTGLLTAMVAGISGISLIVGGVGVMNIMLVTVTERTKEIGLLKAIGAKQADILIQFLIEAMTLSLIGGLIGIGLGVFGAFIVSLVANIPFVVKPLSLILAVGISSLVGIVFGLYPARRAAQLNPIDALRYE